MSLNLPSTNLQVSVAAALAEVRQLSLRQALMDAVSGVPLSILNRQLDENAPPDDLRCLASRGIRGELIFPVPCLLEKHPRLLGYYRLLMGYSQKEFYHKGQLGRFSAMEEKGVVPEKVRGEIAGLCRAFCERGSELLAGLGIDQVSASLLDELTMLTLGPQLRGSNNTKIGKAASFAVFEIIERAVGHAVMEKSATKLVLRNASKREVSIAFSSDPDIKIVELVSAESQRNIVAIEIKGGADRSNIWNRLGEAEKSHQSAKQRGFVEFWTIYNLNSLDIPKAREKSPTTNRFYSLPELQEGKSKEFKDFRDHLISLVGIRTKGRSKR
jgi:hypothetical protein